MVADLTRIFILKRLDASGMTFRGGWIITFVLIQQELEEIN